MSLPAGFQFSQGSLQDYVDCHRRFQLRYLLRQAWPAVESEPVLESERFMQQGARFHRLVQQHLLGVPAERLAVFAQDEDLERWWNNYLQVKNPSGVEKVKAFYPEISLSAALGGFRLVAKYDLVVAGDDDRLVIVDWKTSRKRTKRKWLAERLQSRVYPYLLVRAGGQLLARAGAMHGGKEHRLGKEHSLGKEHRMQRALHLDNPEQVQMVYWFAEFPDQPEQIKYNQSQYEHDESFLKSLIAEIERRKENDFDLTPDPKRCAYCVYRSLCDRGRAAGEWDDETTEALEASDGADIVLDFEQIAEIEF